MFGGNDWEKLGKESVGWMELVEKNRGKEVDVREVYSFKRG